MRAKDAVGRFGEQVAAGYLESAGMTLLDRNWRCREGELDLVASDGADLVFIEVKTRSSLAFGTPAEAVNPHKAARIRLLALRWLADHPAGDSYRASLRFDVVCVLRTRSGPPDVQHLRGAF